LRSCRSQRKKWSGDITVWLLYIRLYEYVFYFMSTVTLINFRMNSKNETNHLKTKWYKTLPILKQLDSIAILDKIRKEQGRCTLVQRIADEAKISLSSGKEE
jgi:hypothetical protein